MCCIAMIGMLQSFRCCFRAIKHVPFYSEMRTVFTIHNLLYQGVFPYSVLGELLGLDDSYFSGVEYYGNVNYMKGGIVHSDHVTTVSPTYAEEIRTAYYGYGLDGLLSSRADSLSGIVNGIDTKSYNPNTDPQIFTRYRSNLAKKAENKLGLQQELGLPQLRIFRWSQWLRGWLIPRALIS